MSEKEFEVSLELGTPALSPVHARLSVGVSRRWSGRGAEVLDAALKALPETELASRLEGAPELDALLVRAIHAAAESGYAAKRSLLAKVVRQAVLDDALIDEAALITTALSQVEAVHVRCLEIISRTEQSARQSGEMGPLARSAEKPLTDSMRAATADMPTPVLVSLLGLGLVDGQLMWDGSRRITGMTTFGEDLLNELRQFDG